MNDREPFIYIKQMYMKGFFDLEENCKEKIISEDYWDFIGTVRSQNVIHFWICSR